MRQILISGNVATGNATLATLPEGAIGLFDASTNALITPGSDLSEVPLVYLAQGVAAGSMPIKTAAFSGKNVTSWLGKAYVAPARMKATIGFAGSGSFTLPVANSAAHTLKVRDLSSGQEPFPINSKTVEGDASATPYEIAALLAKQHNADKQKFTVTTVLTDVAATAISGSETVTTINGSRTVTSSGTSHGVTAGSFIRIGGTAKTLPVWEVASVSGAVITLKYPYWNAAQAAGQSTSAVACSKLDSAPASSASGLVVEAMSTNTVVAVACGDSLAGATVTYTDFNPGFGTGAQVRAMEDRYLGEQGYHNRVWLPQTPDLRASATGTYNVYNLKFEAVRKDATLMQGSVGDAVEVVIAIPTAATTVKTAFEQAINDYLAPAHNAVNL